MDHLGFRNFPAPLSLAVPPVGAVPTGASHRTAIGNIRLGLHGALRKWIQHPRGKQVLCVYPGSASKFWALSFLRACLCGLPRWRRLTTAYTLRFGNDDRGRSRTDAGLQSYIDYAPIHVHEIDPSLNVDTTDFTGYADLHRRGVDVGSELCHVLHDQSCPARRKLRRVLIVAKLGEFGFERPCLSKQRKHTGDWEIFSRFDLLMKVLGQARVTARPNARFPFWASFSRRTCLNHHRT